MKAHFVIAATLACLAASAQNQPVAGAQQPDPVWPKEIDDGGIRLVVYQPQVDSWKKDRLEMRAAATATRQRESNEIFGVITISARTEVDKEVRMVGLSDLKIAGMNFPGAGPGQAQLQDMIRRAFQSQLGSISLDRLLADVSVGNAEFESESGGTSLKNDPPRIILSTSPAVLIVVDGEPVLREVAGTKYKRILNTPALLLYDSPASTYYLDALTYWMTAKDLKGPWSRADAAPADLQPIRAQVLAEEEKDPHDHSKDPAVTPPGPPSAVYIASGPAELIQTQGEPQFAPIPKTQLLYVTNTGSDIFADIRKQNFYVLLAGRWYTAKSLNGPWSFLAGQKLPRDFSRIPPDSPKSAALASVPGTVEAKEAVIANQVPQTAVVKRSEAKLTVKYDGAPIFKPIEGTGLEYAINTPADVIHAEGRYYALQDGVWFVSAAPSGPWAVADRIPPAIYSIPPSSPLYHVRFVSVYGYTDEYVDFGYTPGYLGAFVSDGVVVFGTGWWYPGWYGDLYFGWPWTWGFGYRFGYWTGGWFWQPVGGYWWYHNPWNAHRIFHWHHHPHWAPTDTDRIRGNANVYSRWPASTVVRRGLRQPPLTTAAGAAQRPDLYAGKDGHVYERRVDGWYQRESSGPAKKVKIAASLNNEHQARSLGLARQREFQSTGHAAGIPHVSAPRMGGMGGGGAARPAGGGGAAPRSAGGRR